MLFRSDVAADAAREGAGAVAAAAREGAAAVKEGAAAVGAGVARAADRATAAAGDAARAVPSDARIRDSVEEAKRSIGHRVREWLSFKRPKDAGDKGRDSVIMRDKGTAVTGAIADAGAAAKEALADAGKSVKSVARDVADTVTRSGGGGDGSRAGERISESVKDTVKDAAGAAKEAAKDVAGAAKDAVKDTARGLARDAKGAMADAKAAVADSAAAVADRAKGAVVSAADTVARDVKQAAGAVAGEAKGAVQSAARSVADSIDTHSHFHNQLPQHQHGQQPPQQQQRRISGNMGVREDYSDEKAYLDEYRHNFRGDSYFPPEGPGAAPAGAHKVGLWERVRHPFVGGGHAAKPAHDTSATAAAAAAGAAAAAASYNADTATMRAQQQQQQLQQQQQRFGSGHYGFNASDQAAERAESALATGAAPLPATASAALAREARLEDLVSATAAGFDFEPGDAVPAGAAARGQDPGFAASKAGRHGMQEALARDAPAAAPHVAFRLDESAPLEGVQALRPEPVAVLRVRAPKASQASLGLALLTLPGAVRARLASPAPASPHSSGGDGSTSSEGSARRAWLEARRGGAGGVTDGESDSDPQLSDCVHDYQAQQQQGQQNKWSDDDDYDNGGSLSVRSAGRFEW